MDTKFFKLTRVSFSKQTPLGVKKTKLAHINTCLFIASAKNAGYKVTSFVGFNGFIIGRGKHQEILYRQQIINNSAATRITDNKLQTKSFLGNSGLPTPKGFSISNQDGVSTRQEIFNALQKPIVVKPTFGTFGHNVFTDIIEFSEFNKSLDIIFSEYPGNDHVTNNSLSAVVEEQIENNCDYRLFCTPEKCLGVIYRIPANIIGDGKSTIRQLINQKNEARKVHKKITLDDSSEKLLAKQGLTPESIPSNKKQVFLRRVANTSAGGDCLQITNKIDKSLKNIAIAAVRSIPGLKYAGVDILSKNGLKNQKDQAPTILEINHSPDISAFYYPTNNKPLDIVKLLLKEIL